jgi:murein DD-endopeptidase MepM/ murein hydrolase activator NlpD
VREIRDRARRNLEITRQSKLEIESARDAIAAEQQRLEDARSSLEIKQGEVADSRAQQERVLARVEDEIVQHEEVAADLRAEVEATVAEASAGSSMPAGPLSSPSASGLIWPVDGVLTSTFGLRWGSSHEGIDISAAEGTPIRAADSGAVILLQSEAESGGYGNYTCVDHGNAVSTCYAHQSGFNTTAGASVSQGEIIGYVGNTGHSFGAHLHFEVRISGVATDPLAYL